MYAQVHTINSGAEFGPRTLDPEALSFSMGAKIIQQGYIHPWCLKPTKTEFQSWFYHKLCDLNKLLNLPEPNEISLPVNWGYIYLKGLQ